MYFNRTQTGFFAYPASPEYHGEFIEEAIKKIHKSGILVLVQSWKNLNIGGNLIISKILRQIEEADFFCADITGLNENVLFELGFAIGKKKPVWIIQDTSIHDSYNRYKELNFLAGVGYVNYTKSDDIVNGFLKDKVYEKKDILIDQLTSTLEINDNKNALLFLKRQHDTDYNQYIINTIKNSKLPFILDDAAEVRVQPLTWYISQLLNVPSVLVEFSSTYRTGYELQNAKCSFIAGLAVGLGLKVLMVSEKPFPTAVDYQEYLKKFTNLELCKAAIAPFIADLKQNIVELYSKNVAQSSIPRIKTRLQQIKFGEYIAEHESAQIYDYYVNTAHDDNIIKSEYNIVVGRKGSGKTATLYYLERAISRDVRNQVVTIKPVNFEIDGLVELIKKLKSDFEKGFIIESIWKFLIYSEVANLIYQNLKEKPIYGLDEVDREIIDFVEKNETIILTDFSTRLEQELKNLAMLEKIEEQSQFRNKISEILHDNIISRLKELIIAYMNKKNKLAILIDNLDKNWRKGNEIGIISKFILGLLGVVGRISRELKGNPKDPNDFDINLVVFLRSDIFKNVLSFAREPDKIEYNRLMWNDKEILFRIVDRRIEFFSGKFQNPATEFWEKYIISNVDGISTKDYIMSCIVPRPRDLIYFLNSAKSIAVARGHDMIDAQDLMSAYNDYSNWVFKSLFVENGVTLQEIETFLYNCMGENSILDRTELIKLIRLSGIENEDRIEYFINHLCSLSFLGRETKPSEFSYEYDFENDLKIKTLADKLGTNRFKINNAFIPYLECSDYVI